MGAKLIVLGGKTYRSMEEMPPDVREKYELAMCLLGDPDENYVPELSQSGGILAGRNHNSSPDKVEHAATTNVMIHDMKIPIPTTNVSTSFGTKKTDQPAAPAPLIPVVTPDTDISNDRIILSLAGLLLFLVCAAALAGVWYFYLR